MLTNALALIRRGLAHRLLAVALVALAALLAAPTLRQGLILDDLAQSYLMLQETEVPEFAGHPAFDSPDAGELAFTVRSYFAFLDREGVAQCKDYGNMPWWTDDDNVLRFFRPLTSATHWLDYRLWPEHHWVMHLHSLFWLFGVVAVAALLYRRLMGATWVAGLAALLFCVDDAHFTPVNWIANRNALIAVFFGMLALWAHDRWRRSGWRPGAVMAPSLLVLSLLSADAGLATVGYLAAHLAFLDRAGWRSRLGWLGVYAGIGIGWRVAVMALGFEVHAGSYYLDPTREPWLFLASLVDNGPVLLWGQLGLPDPIVANLLTAPARQVFWWACLGLLAGVGLLGIPLLRRERPARFFAGGMLLSIVPICAKTMPDGALLVFTGIGGMGLVALFVGGVIEGADWRPRHWTWGVPAWVLSVLALLVHGLLAPYGLYATARQPVAVQVLQEKINDLGAIPDIEHKVVVILNSPGVFAHIYLPFQRIHDGEPFPDRLRVLAPGYFPLEVERVDARSLRVDATEGFMPTQQALQDPERPFDLRYINLVLDGFARPTRWSTGPGQEVRVPGMVVRIESLLPDGWPRAATFRFDRPLEDAALVWLRWDWSEETYRPFDLPASGQAVTVPGM